MKKILSLLIVCLLFSSTLFLGGCSSKSGDSWLKRIFSPQEEEEGPVPPEAQLTAKAMHYFEIGRYLLAEEEFKKIRDRYPFSPYATVAELRLADCKYYQGLYEEAIPLYQDFENLHPTNEAIPYVIFQIGSCYYHLMDTPDRDQTSTHKMIETYTRLISRYPDSPFTLEAQRRIKEGRAVLAEHEYVVAHWYFRTDHIPQAIKRLENIITLYPDTPIYHKAVMKIAEYKDVAEHLDEYVKAEEKKEEEKKLNHHPWWKNLWPF